jgi:hypothetical protein
MNTNFIQTLGSADFESWLLVQKAYKDYAFGEEIMETGFNTNSGYVYIALENGIQIASCFGQSVDFIVFDFETGEEYFLDSYDEAMGKINNI